MLKAYDMAGCIEAGTDEAGRGCIAGPVFAAAVILPEEFEDPGLNDSKLLSRSGRERFRDYIISHAKAWAVASATAEEIDEINILNASILSMHRAIDGLGIQPGHIIVDGNRFKPYGNIPFTCFVKGDGRYASIAAASILAKTFRDDFMRKAAAEWPEYGWEQNCGYPTKAHREAVMRYGLTPLHRKSFRILPDPELF
ncbi:MAG TPA: ribonuclease HII [Candidatus Coprenecus stercorigallinarum]|nr:ribonuclease HII [Candidatus Coprenecus stercorigallinarum]